MIVAAKRERKVNFLRFTDLSKASSTFLKVDRRAKSKPRCHHARSMCTHGVVLFHMKIGFLLYIYKV